MSKEIDLFSSNAALPAHVRNASGGGLTNAIADTIGGEAVPTIGLKGSRFRLKEGGQELAVRDEHYLDVVIVAAAPAISRIYYSTTYGSEEQQKPACFSADGVKPSLESVAVQCTTCALCPQNEKGSRISDNGQPAKACAYYRRLGVMLLGDPSGKVYRLDVKSQGLFGDGLGAGKSFNEYVKLLRTRDAELTSLVTRLTFDTNASVPKLLFTATRWLTDEEYAGTSSHDRDAADAAVKIEYKGTSVGLQAEEAFDLPGTRPTLAAPVAAPVAAPAPAPKPAAAKPAPPKAVEPAPVVVQPAAPVVEAPIITSTSSSGLTLQQMLDEIESF